MSQNKPVFRGVEHVGFTVPDIEEATRFLVDVMGCEQFYDLGPFVFDDDWMQLQLNVHPRAQVKKLRFFRVGHGPNFEVFEYESPDQNYSQPRNSDIGGHHLAFYADDFDAALNWLRANRVARRPILQPRKQSERSHRGSRSGQALLRQYRGERTRDRCS